MASAPSTTLIEGLACPDELRHETTDWSVLTNIAIHTFYLIFITLLSDSRLPCFVRSRISVHFTLSEVRGIHRRATSTKLNLDEKMM